jgi:hypothetical protein
MEKIMLKSQDLSNPAIQLALHDMEKLTTDRQWTTMFVEERESGFPYISIRYGTIHSNGEREQAIATLVYSIYLRTGEPYSTKFVHP